MTAARLIGAAAAALALAYGPPAAAHTASSPDATSAIPTVVPDSVFTSPQQLVAVEGGRRLNLYCVGAGAPTVILEAGAANTMQTWRYVQGEIAKTTRVCAYDRAGLGFSDAATRPADVRNMADDLRRLVAAAGVSAPFVLVGHSLGGEIAVYAAATTPTDVAGLVLVDPAFADDLDALEAALPPKDRRAIGTAMAHALERDRTCLDSARNGELARPASPVEQGCTNTRRDPNRLDAALAAAARMRLAEAKTWEAVVSELEALSPEGNHADANSAELDAAALDFGAKPLVVLSRGVAEFPGVPPSQIAGVEAAWIAGHAALAARSTKGDHIVVPGARHYIQIDRPQAVVDATLKVVKQVRSK